MHEGILITDSFSMGSGHDIVSGNAVQVFINGRMMESEHIRGKIGVVRRVPDREKLDKQAAIFKKQYPDLELQDNLKMTGGHWKNL